ncbi:MAG: hypothetical protein PHV68_09985 [Candidatus Gastranaerophilales bacterium]|jgi:hypothetical protein|nr:hypothetical protein [Candidatus Gastranaerophilales bacterium]
MIVGQRAYIKQDVEKGILKIYTVKSIKENVAVVGNCSCRKDLYRTVQVDDLLSYEQAKSIYKKLYLK